MSPSSSPPPSSPSSSSTTTTSLSQPSPLGASASNGGGIGVEGGEGSGATRPAGLMDGLRSISAGDLTSVHQTPCAREAFLFGLGAGFCAGGVHFVVRAHAWRAMNWFVGSWALGSAGAYQFCRRRRELERLGMGRAMEIMDRKKREKAEEMARARDELRARRDEKAHKEEERSARFGDWRRWFRPADEGYKEAEQERKRLLGEGEGKK